MSHFIPSLMCNYNYIFVIVKFLYSFVKHLYKLIYCQYFILNNFSVAINNHKMCETYVSTFKVKKCIRSFMYVQSFCFLDITNIAN